MNTASSSQAQRGPLRAVSIRPVFKQELIAFVQILQTGYWNQTIKCKLKNKGLLTGGFDLSTCTLVPVTGEAFERTNGRKDWNKIVGWESHSDQMHWMRAALETIRPYIGSLEEAFRKSKHNLPYGDDIVPKLLRTR